MVNGLLLSQERGPSPGSGPSWDFRGYHRTQGTNQRHQTRMPMCSQAVYLSKSKEERERMKGKIRSPKVVELREK